MLGRFTAVLAVGSALAVSSACASSGPGTNADGAGAASATGGSSAATSTGGSSSGGTSTGGSGTSGKSGTSGSGAGATGGTDASFAGAAGAGAGDNGGSSSTDGGAGGATDAPYANVTAVAVSGSDGDYTFNVSIESSDIDCTLFANWWEVLAEDGTLLYRRILEHSHTDANGTSDANAPGNTFTRSGGPVPAGADDVVIVRAHISTGGYNGMAMRGSAASGFSAAPEIGPDFAASVESEDPQPTGCEF